MLSTTGVYLYGYAGSPTQPWTHLVLASATFGGPETEIHRKVTADAYAHIAAPGPGPYFYRTCAINTSTMARWFRLRMTAEGPWVTGSPTAPSSPTTAVLGPGGWICNEFTAEAGHLLGEADASVLFYGQAFDENYALGDTLFSIQDSAVDVSVAAQPFGALMCAKNTSAATATLSLEFVLD
jgi:hypothetical protein